MTLSDKEADILAAAELDAKASIEILSSITGFQPHTIRYTLQKLQDRGIIKPLTFIDVYRLGIQDYAFYFSLSSSSNAHQQEVIQYMKTSPQVSWLGGLGGDFQFGAAIYVRTTQELLDFLDHLTGKFGNIFFRKAVTLRVEFIRFSRKYLSGRIIAPVPQVHFGHQGKVTIDEIDHQILHELGNTGDSPNTIAKTLSVPPATVYKRVEKLEKQEVITGYTFAVDSLALGMHTYELLIHAKGLHRGLRERLLKFAQQNPYVIHYVQTVGEWDYELGVEFPQAEMVNNLTRSLYDSFSEDINSISVLPLFKYHKETYYPF